MEVYLEFSVKAVISLRLWLFSILIEILQVHLFYFFSTFWKNDIDFSVEKNSFKVMLKFILNSV